MDFLRVLSAAEKNDFNVGTITPDTALMHS